MLIPGRRIASPPPRICRNGFNEATASLHNQTEAGTRNGLSFALTGCSLLNSPARGQYSWPVTSFHIRPWTRDPVCLELAASDFSPGQVLDQDPLSFVPARTADLFRNLCSLAWIGPHRPFPYQIDASATSLASQLADTPGSISLRSP